jgi:hypothetical protein
MPLRRGSDQIVTLGAPLRVRDEVRREGWGVPVLLALSCRAAAFWVPHSSPTGVVYGSTLRKAYATAGAILFRCAMSQSQSAARRRRSALPITDTELKAMAALAIIGLSSRPKKG